MAWRPILRAATPLERYQREAFMTALALLLQGRKEIGDGELFRILRDLQREHFDFPAANCAVAARLKSRRVSASLGQWTQTSPSWFEEFCEPCRLCLLAFQL
jgi:hypothetical protein